MILRRKSGLAVLLASAALLLSGCGSLQPGVAAVVGSATISHDEVDRVAAALCSANLGSAQAQGQPAPSLATAGARQGALQVLLDSEIARLFGEQEGVEADNQQISEAVAQNEPGIALLPESQRADFREALEEYAAGQLMLIEIGRNFLEERGDQQITDDLALTEGQRLRSEFLRSVDVEIDPRYGTFEEESLKPGGTALSVAVSEQARAANRAEPPPAYVKSLPASQRCG